jgi:hypothetical protein
LVLRNQGYIGRFTGKIPALRYAATFSSKEFQPANAAACAMQPAGDSKMSHSKIANRLKLLQLAGV